MENLTINELTAEEKATLCCGKSFFQMAGVPRLGLKGLRLLDGGTGLNFEQLFGDFCSEVSMQMESTGGMASSGSLNRVIEYFYEPEKLQEEDLPLYDWIKEKLYALAGCEYAPGCFPSGMLLGATFDPEVIYNMGVALGEEAHLYHIDILLGTPNVNIHRDPLGGRLFEGYSEDPYLVSALAPALVKGVQSTGTIANVKHFAANNQETNRVGINETISERALQEIYLPGFKACVQEGNVLTVMSAYNAINGTPCSESHMLLTEILRDEWGFDGSVVSDWGAVYHPVEALKAGNDLAMPGPISPKPLLDAYEKGELSDKDLNAAAARLLKLVVRQNQANGDDVFGIDSAAASEGNAETFEGNAGIFEANAGIFDANAETFEATMPGVNEESLAKLYEKSTKAAYEAATSGIVLLKNENSLFPLSAVTPGNLLLLGSAAKKLMECGSGSAGITTSRTSSLAGTLSGNLPGHDVTLLSPDTPFADVEKYLETHENCIILYEAMVGGMEGNDRYDLSLSAEDDALLKKLGALKGTLAFSLVLTLNVCGPVSLTEYEESLDAIFVCFLPGMEGAHALGDIMCGRLAPSGKLPLTFPKRYEDTPTFLNFPGDGYEVHYGEGIYVGYRYYDKKKIEPAYPFGFGLSYTTFALSDLQVSGELFSGEIKGNVTVENTGDMPGAEVVQIYLSDEKSTLLKPAKELKYFKKVHLAPGEKKCISFSFTEADFASYDPNYHKWIAEEGYYQILVGTSSAPTDLPLSRRVYLKNETPYSYGLHSTVKIMYEKAALKQALLDLFAAEGWDRQIIETNYQYTPNKSLTEIFPKAPAEVHVARFLSQIATVKHD